MKLIKSVIASVAILMSDVYALPPLETNNLSKNEIHLLKQYVNEPSFSQYYSKGGDVSETHDTPIEYTSNLNLDRLNEKFASKTYLMRSCAAKIINGYIGKQLIFNNDECYIYAYTSYMSLFKRHNYVNHRQIINIHAITSNPYSCSELGSCSKTSSQTFNLADLSDKYVRFISYYNRCLSENCKINIAYIAYYASQYAETVNNL